VRSRHQVSLFAGWFRRVVAGGSAALVLFLTTLAASPELHSRFHGTAQLGNDEGCAVALFASGVSLAAGPVTVEAPEVTWTEPAAAAPEKLFLVASRYLRQPERGPPLS
jgi:hypothetical protein